MPHIQLSRELAGIVSLFDFSPATATPLNQLAEVLLRTNASPSFTRMERELVGTYVSYLNACKFCYHTHREMVNYMADDEDRELVEQVIRDYRTAPVREKVKALLHIAETVQGDARKVTPDMIGRAKKEGASDHEIHDTVLIAAAFCMYNRYVDGLATVEWDDQDTYRARARATAEDSYFHDQK